MVLNDSKLSFGDSYSSFRWTMGCSVGKNMVAVKNRLRVRGNSKVKPSNEKGSVNKSTIMKYMKMDSSFVDSVFHRRKTDHSSTSTHHGGAATRKTQSTDEGELIFDEETAATKIQANFRGFKARKELDSKMKGQEASKANSRGGQSKSSQPPEEEVDIDLTDPEIAKAATKIQASFRGHKVRKEVKPVVDQTFKNASDQAKTRVEEEVDLDLTDPELEKAATKIQATFRGYQSKKK